MTVEPYVVVPLAVFKAMQKRNKEETSVPKDHESGQVSHESSKSNDMSAANVEQEDNLTAQSLAPSEHFSSEEGVGKNLTKKYQKRHLSKLLKLVEKEPELTMFSNLDELVNDAVSPTSKKYLQNEAKFYQILLESNLSKYVRNRAKIHKYFPGIWYHI